MALIRGSRENGNARNGRARSPRKAGGARCTSAGPGDSDWHSCSPLPVLDAGLFEEQALAGRELHDLAGVENRDAVAEVGSDADIARDEQQGAAMTGGKTA